MLKIDPQNVGVDTISVGLDSGKSNRLADSVCETLGIKIAHKVEINAHSSPKQSPPTMKHSPSSKMSPKLVLPKVASPKIGKCPTASFNGVRDKYESPKSSPPYTPIKVHTPGSAIKVATPGSKNMNSRGRGLLSSKERDDQNFVSEGKGANSIKISVAAPRHRIGSSSRSSTESESTETNLLKSIDSPGSSTLSIVKRENNSNVIKIVTNRKRRSSAEAPKYSEIDEDRKNMTKKSRGSVKARGKSSRRARGGGIGARSVKGFHDLENTTTWVCAICGQYDPILPGSSCRDGDTTEWIGCDCNRLVFCLE